MRKFLLLVSMLPVCANAANMCVKNDTLLVVLDPNIVPTTTYDNNARTWTATFSFGTVSGIAGCAAANNVGGSTNVGVKTSPQTAMNINGTAKNGVMCGCKMLLPVESYWINGAYLSSTPNSVECGTICAQHCANQMKTVAVTTRAGIFGNVIP